MNLSMSKAPAVAAALLLLAAAGCTDLTVEPTSTVTESNIFNDPSSYQAFIAREYAGRDRQDILRDLRKNSGSRIGTRSIGQQTVEPSLQHISPPQSSEEDGDKGKKKDGPASPPVVGPY